MSALTSNCIVPFSLLKRNDVGQGYANVYLIVQQPQKYVPQYVNPESSIYFNKFGKLASIAWMKADELTFLKNGTFRVQFFINSALNYSNVQIALYVNGLQFDGTYGSITNTTYSGSQINGEFTLKVEVGDVIKLVNKYGSFIISQTGPIGQILASMTVTEINIS